MGKPKALPPTLTPRQVLENKLAELTASIRDHDGITIDKKPDALDEVQNAADRELAIRTLDIKTQNMREVRAAIRRIKEGTYGTCECCLEDISPKRLKAVPEASLCIICKQRLDQETEKPPATLEAYA